MFLSHPSTPSLDMVKVVIELSTRKYRLIAFDLDGVLTESRSSWEHVHDYFGVPMGSRRKNFLDYVWGRIDYNEWIKRDIELWNKALGRKLRREDLLEAIDGVKVNDDVGRVVGELKGRGFIVGIISAGIGQLAEKIASKHGFDFWIANPITFTSNGVVSDNQRARMPPYRKPLTLLWIARRYGVSIRETIYVGDSDWDIGVIKLAGCGIAYNCSTKLAGNANIVVNKLSEVLEAIAQC